MDKKLFKQKRFIAILIVLILLVALGIAFETVRIIGLHSETTDDNTVVATPEANFTEQPINEKASSTDASTDEQTTQKNGKVVVLDAGHGKSSSLMSEAEKTSSGYVKNNGAWGEWRHFKSGTANVECEGSGCNQNKTCWYPIGSGDRDTEPNINLQNVLSAKKYLEDYGYEVRLTRSTNDENPSFTKRVSACYPNGNMTVQPDADIYVCVHSNAGGGSGSAYITCGSNYDQKWIGSNYACESNKLGQMINNCIINETSLTKNGSGAIDGEGWLILFNKCPVPVAYMEIGFFDNSNDLAIINSEHDKIGKAIADGIHEYLGD